MRWGIFGAIVVAVAALAGSASSAPASDIYIWGKVLGRAHGSSASLVEMTWAYKCLGDKLGYATYDWTLKVERDAPLPKKTTVVGHGTSKRGSMTVRLSPGNYLPFSDPYECTTERGAGYTNPEIGQPFVVPDYCAWSLSSVRGAVQLEHGTAVKAARPGSAAAPGDVLVTPKNGAATASSLGEDGSVSLGAATRLGIDREQCPGKGGWLLRLESGSVAASVPAAASPSRRYEVAAPTVTTSGAKGAHWNVRIAKGKTIVHVAAGTVHAAKGAAGEPVVLKAGQTKSFR